MVHELGLHCAILESLYYCCFDDVQYYDSALRMLLYACMMCRCSLASLLSGDQVVCYGQGEGQSKKSAREAASFQLLATISFALGMWEAA